MIRIYKTNLEKAIEQIDDIERDSWIDLVNPTKEEIDFVCERTLIDRDLIEKMSDDDELPRIENSGNATLVVIDAPVKTDDEDEFETYPLGVILSKNNYIVTVSLQKVTVLSDFRHNRVSNFRTAKKSRFLIQIFGRVVAEYLKILNKVYREIETNEDKLQKSTKNEDLLDLLASQKTLVYFTTSLKENDAVLEKISGGNVVELFTGDADLLEDTMIENKQAIDMAGVYQNILQSITETYATVISNNLNDVMKFLTSITLVLSIPTIIFSFFGMNVKLGWFEIDNFSAMAILIGSFVLSAGILIWLKKKGLL